MEKISVIIPVYNCAEYIEECLESVRKQRSDEFGLEIIIVNDGSNDDSDAIIKRFLDDDCKYIVQDNQGLSGARNTGIVASSGEYVFFLDSDDILPDNALLYMYRAIVASGDDVVIGKMMSFNSSYKKDYYYNKWIKAGMHVTYLKEKHLLDIISVCGKLYRRTSIEELRFLPRLTHEDNYYSLSLYNKELKYTLISEAVYNRRIREGNNKSITQGLGLKTYKDLLTNYYAFLENNQITSALNYSLSKKTTRYIAKFVQRIDVKEAKNLQRKLWRYMDERTMAINKFRLFICRFIWLSEMELFRFIS